MSYEGEVPGAPGEAPGVLAGEEGVPGEVRGEVPAEEGGGVLRRQRASVYDIYDVRRGGGC